MANGGIKDGLTGRQRSANSWYSRTKRGKVKLFTNVPGDVLHACSEGNCTWHGRQLHFYRQHPTDESGRQVNRQAWKWSIHWRQDSWWMGCRDARLPPRHWKQFSQCQSGRNKWLKYRLGHTVMDFQTLMLCRSTTLSGGGTTRWQPRWTLIEAYNSWHIKLSRQKKSPQAADMKYSGCLHNQQPFLATLVGDVFPHEEKNCVHMCSKRTASFTKNLKVPERHQMTALHWKLWVNYFVATLILPMSYCWLNVSSVSKPRPWL